MQNCGGGEDNRRLRRRRRVALSGAKRSRRVSQTSADYADSAAGWNEGPQAADPNDRDVPNPDIESHEDTKSKETEPCPSTRTSFVAFVLSWLLCRFQEMPSFLMQSVIPLC